MRRPADRSAVATGDRLRLTGIVGQRASRKGALDGYRVWLRGAADLVRLGGATASGVAVADRASPSPAAARRPARSPPRSSPASGSCTIEGSVTTAASLLDATNRRVVVQDRTAAIEVLLPRARPRPRSAPGPDRGRGRPGLWRAADPGRHGSPPRDRRRRPVGAAGRARRRPRVAPRPDPRRCRRGPPIGRSLDRRAPRRRHPRPDRRAGGRRDPVGGPRHRPDRHGHRDRPRPYPSATDRRFALVPRSPRDLILGGPVDDGPASGSAASGPTASGAAGAPAGSGTATPPPDLDLADLAAHVGELVRVGGLVQAVDPAGFRLDDGTAIRQVRLRAAAVDLAGSVVVGDALSATGRVELDPGDGSPVVAVDDPAGIALVGGVGTGDPGASRRPGWLAGRGGARRISAAHRTRRRLGRHGRPRRDRRPGARRPRPGPDGDRLARGDAGPPPAAAAPPRGPDRRPPRLLRRRPVRRPAALATALATTATGGPIAASTADGNPASR